MPKQAYKNIRFRSDSLELIERVNSIVIEYDEQGYELTLRQVYYQLVARGFIPNNERSYKNLGNLINDGRLAGLIDWHSIVDRTRFIRRNSHWSTPQSVINSAKYSYMLNRWNDQPNYVEVWVEKDALIGIVSQVCKISRFGHECWELDALEPKVITQLIEDEVTALIDYDLFNAIAAQENRDKANIQLICDRYDEVVDYLKDA